MLCQVRFDDNVKRAMLAPSDTLSPGSWYVCFGYVLHMGVFFFPSNTYEGDAMLCQVWFDDIP